MHGLTQMAKFYVVITSEIDHTSLEKHTTVASPFTVFQTMFFDQEATLTSTGRDQSHVDAGDVINVFQNPPKCSMCRPSFKLL